MKCQNCNKNEATTFIKQNINGKGSEMHLCSDCALLLGYQGFGAFVNPFELFSNVFSPERKGVKETKRCKECGISFDEIVKSGRVGCPACYTEFFEQLSPTIKKLHGNSRHMGTHPVSSSAEPAENKLDELKKQLEKAVEEQNYEQAAVIRDKIKEMEA